MSIKTKRKIIKTKKKEGKNIISKKLKVKDVKNLKWKSFYAQISETALTPNFLNNLHKDEDHDESSSALLDALEIASDNNYSEDFTNFSKSLRQYSSLPLILFNKDEIWKIFISHCSHQNILDLQVLYEVLIGFISDIQDFSSYYPQFLEIFVESLKIRDNVPLIKSMFQCLNHSIVTQISCTINSLSVLQNILDLTLPTLFNFKKNPDFVIEFAAHSLSSLLRKSKFKNTLISHLISNHLEENTVHGIAKLFVASIRNVQGTFYSVSQENWNLFHSETEKETPMSEKLISCLYENTLHSNPSIEEFSSLLFISFEYFSREKCLSALSVLLNHQKYLPQNGTFEAMLLKIRVKESFSFFLNVLPSLLTVSETIFSGTALKRLIKSLFENCFGNMGSIIHSVLHSPRFDSLILPTFVSYSQENSSSLNLEEFVTLVSNIVSFKIKAESLVLELPIIEFIYESPNSCETLPNRVLALEPRSSVLTALLSLRPLNNFALVKKFKSHLSLFEKDFEKLSLFSELLYSTCTPVKYTELLEPLIPILKEQHMDNTAILRIWFRLTSLGTLEFPHTLNVLSSYSKLHRSLVLSSMNQCINKDPLIPLLYEAELMESSFSSIREKLRLISSLEYRVERSEYQKEICLRFLLSCLTLNFSMIWKPVCSVIMTYANSNTQDLFWSILLEVLKDAYSRIIRPLTSYSHDVDVINYRNLLVESIAADCSSLQLERVNKTLVSFFLDYFLVFEYSQRGRKGESKTVVKISKSLFAHLKLFSQFPNFQSLHRFKEIESFVLTLFSDSFSETRKWALNLFSNHSKDVKEHKDLLMGLCGKFPLVRNALTNASELNSRQILSIYPYLTSSISGILKGTRGEKRPQQLTQRKLLLEKINKLQTDSFTFLSHITGLLNPEYLETLNQTLSQKAAFPSPKEDYSELTFDILLHSRQYLASNEKICLTLISLLQNVVSKHDNSFKSKSKSKILVMMTSLFNNFKGQYLWSKEKQENFLKYTLEPLLNHGSNQEETNKISTSRKLMTFLKLLSEQDDWFYVSNERLLIWILQNVDSKNGPFKKMNLELLCHVLVNTTCAESLESSICLQRDSIFPLLLHSIHIAGKPETVSLIFKALYILLKSRQNSLYFISSQDLDHLAILGSKIKFSQTCLQNEIVDLISFALSSRREGDKNETAESPLPNSVFTLLYKVQETGKRSKYAEVLLSYYVQNHQLESLKGPEICGNICEVASELIGKKSEELSSLVFYSAFSELNRSEFTNRRTASDCIITLCKTQSDDFIQKFVLSEIAKSLGSKNLSEETKNEILILLIFLLQEKIQIKEIELLNDLTNVKDGDEDFYGNMKHLQSHRKIRALKRMSTKINSLRNFDEYEKVIFLYVYPLASKLLFNESVIKYSETIDGAMDLIASITSQLHFPKYRKILDYFLTFEPRENSSAFTKQKIKIISRILSSYHFEEGENLKFIMTRVFKLMDNENESSVHDSLYLPVTKILLHYPKLMDSYLNRIVVKLANGLKMREFKARERVRVSLNGVGAILGPNYFSFIFSILDATLRRGFELHVLVYSVKSLLSHSHSSDFEPGSLDSLLDFIVKCVKLELFTKVLSEEKTVSKILSKTPEAKKISSYYLVETFASFVSKSLLLKFLEPFAIQLSSSKDFESLAKLRKIFRGISSGLNSNRDFQKTDLLYLIYAILNDKLYQDKHLQPCTPRQKVVWMEFSFLLFGKLLQGTDFWSKEEIEPFIPLVLRKLSNLKDVELLIEALSIFNRIALHKSLESLVSLHDIFPLLYQNLILNDVFSKSEDKKKFIDLSSSLFTSHLNKLIKLNNFSELESLSVFIRYLLDSSVFSVSVIRCFETILGVKKLSKFRQDILHKLLTKSIKSSHKNSITSASCTLLRFLKHSSPNFSLKFLFQQLEYSSESGRLQAMTLIARILEQNKTCGKELEFQPSFIFLSVSKAYGNEVSFVCKKALLSIINALTCSEYDIKSIEQLLESWISSQEVNLRVLGSKMICELSSLSNNLSSLVFKLSSKLIDFIKSSNKSSLDDFIRLDYLRALENIRHSEVPSSLLFYVNELLMSSNVSLRNSSIHLLASSLGRASQSLEHGDLYRQLLLNVFQILSSNAVFDESVFEDVSILCIYFSKLCDHKLLIGKLIHVAQYEAINLGFSTKRRSMLFSVVGVLITKYPIDSKLLSGCLKVASKLFENKELSDSIEEFYSTLEKFIRDEEQLQMISNSRNRVSFLDSYKMAKRRKILAS